MSSLHRWFCIGIVVTFGYLWGLLNFAIWDIPTIPIEPVTWSQEAQWIGVDEPSYRLYARQVFYVPTESIQAGWLRVSADNNFILYLNGHQIGRQQTHTSSSHRFAGRNTFDNQTVNDAKSYSVKTYTLNLSYPQNWKYTFYVDLTPYLQAGINVLALEVMKAQTNPRAVVEGEIYPGTEASPIQLTTGVAPWKISTKSENRQNLQWWHPDFSDLHWADAQLKGVVKETTYSRLSPQLFKRPFQSHWITGIENSLGEVWLEAKWQAPATWKRAFVRFTSNEESTVLIDDHLVSHILPSETKKPTIYLYEITNLLQPGENKLKVRLARSLTANQALKKPDLLSFVLDGWAETEQGDVVANITTDNTWYSLSSPPANAGSMGNSWQAAMMLDTAKSQNFSRNFKGTTDLYDYPRYIFHQGLWIAGSISFSIVYSFLLGKFCLQQSTNWLSNVCSGSVLLLPGTLFLLGIALLKHRYAESEIGLLFAQVSTNSLTMLGFLMVFQATLLWSQRNKLGKWTERGLWFLMAVNLYIFAGLIAEYKGWFAIFALCGLTIIIGFSQSGYAWQFRSKLISLTQQDWPVWGKWLLLIGVLGVGFALSSYDLGFTPRDSDENTSLNAIAGILRTGVPIMPSGIWYTRSPIYHYLVALWLKLVGDSYINARFVSSVFATATLILVFLFARQLTGKFWLALIITSILAVDPWQLMNARNLRFYQLLEFTTVLAFWSFYKGFINLEGKQYQHIFVVAMTVALLTQEGVSPTLIPCFIVGFLCFYRPFDWKREWLLILEISIGTVLYLGDVLFFTIKCLTPSVGVSAGTSIPLSLHFSDLTGFIVSFFAGNNRINTIYSFFFFLGIFYFLYRHDGKLIYLFCCVLIQLGSITLLISEIAPRYTYPIYPLFIILSIYSLFSIVETIAQIFELIFHNILPLQNIMLVFAILLLLGNLELGRVFASYYDKLSRDNPSVFEYIYQHKQTGDIVIAGNPPGAGNILGSLDYFLPPRLTLSFDGLYSRNGNVVDRWAGGQVISNLEQFNNILKQAPRVWLQLDDNPLPEDIVLDEVYEYTRSLGDPIFETYGVRLRLWQQARGIFPRVPSQGKDIGNY